MQMEIYSNEDIVMYGYQALVAESYIQTEMEKIIYTSGYLMAFGIGILMKCWSMEFKD